MKNKKPLAPWLPGKYGQMTREEFDAESAQYDAEFSATQTKRAPNAASHPRKRSGSRTPQRGRPAKPRSQKSQRVLITLPPPLLAATDVAANQQGLTRAGLIRQAVLDWLASQPTRRKSA